MVCLAAPPPHIHANEEAAMPNALIWFQQAGSEKKFGRAPITGGSMPRSKYGFQLTSWAFILHRPGNPDVAHSITFKAVNKN